MKRFSLSLLVVAFMLIPQLAKAQLIQEKTMSEVNGTTLTAPDEGLLLYSDTQTGGGYPRGTDQTVSIVSNCQNNDSSVFYFSFQNFDVGPRDTVFIYDGPSINSPLLVKCNNYYNFPGSQRFFCSVSNTSNTLTLRFKTASSGSNWNGFTLTMQCNKPCEQLVPFIDSVFYRVRNGEIYDTAYVTQEIYKIDTTFYLDTITNIVDSNRIVNIDTMYFPGVNVCLGDGIIFTGHGEYTNLTGRYTPTDETVEYRWNFATGSDSLYAIGARMAPFDGYFEVGCYDVSLNFVDQAGCRSATSGSVTVRVSPNPLKTIYDLTSICTTDSLFVSVGYDGDNATLTLRTIEYAKTRSKTNAIKTFIPDGPMAAQLGCGPRCYSAPVTFDEFPVGRTVQDVGDICSICVNYEHSFMGDYTLSIVCPNGQKAVLKYQTNDQATHGGAPAASGGGGGRYTGIPYGGDAHGNGSWDNTTTTGLCDSTYNMYGIGWNYCFSRNANYTLCTDDLPCNTTVMANYYLTNGPTVQWTGHMHDVPPHFQQAPNAGDVTVSTVDSSDHANKSNYYMPASDFHELIGCPLNGTWEIEICDEWSVDNGWVFSWSMDICGMSDEGCNYQVGVDHVEWGPDTVGGRHYDMYNGKYRGLESRMVSETESWMKSPDTSGVFPVKIKLYDEFGCVWDTTTRITVVRTPTPDLGPDSMICGDQFIALDAKDYWIKDTLHSGYTYRWDPYGQMTDTIHTTAVIGSTTLYAVEVVHTDANGKRCMGRDTVNIGVSVQPIPNFDPGSYPLEGCEPYTVNVKNSTLNASRYLWDFGDGYKTTDVNPKHTYSTGNYDVKFYAYSNEGCVDSLVYPGLVTVYSSPDARFSWEPAYPTVSQPYVTLSNLTTPENGNFDYFWEIQYDKDFPYSYHTDTNKNTTFTWETNGRDISGDYVARLISRSKNLGPSGNLVYCADTSENTILLINDFLQFPNVVTPNGDGINDRFVILNLVSGQAYPTNCLDIYNKWGARVFHKENIASDEDFWDPAATNSPDGTYFFRFSAKGYNGAVERNGAVEVLR